MLPPENRQAAIFIIIALVLTAFLFQFVIFQIPPYLFIILALTSLIFFIAFAKPNVALVILLFSMLLSPEFGSGSVTGRGVVLRFDDFFILMLFCGWVARMAVQKEIGFLKITPFNKPIVAYVIACLFSSALGIVLGTTNPKYSFFYNLKYIEYFLLFFMVSNNIHNRKQVKLFVSIMIFVSIIVSIFALYVALAQGMRATAPFEGESGEPNTLAGYLILIIGLMIGLFIHSKTNRQRLVLGGLSMLCTFTLLYTLSRSGWLGFGAMYIAFLFFARRNKMFFVALLVIVLVNIPAIAGKMPRVVMQRYEATFRGGDQLSIAGRKMTIDESASIRLNTWRKSIEMWERNPIFGLGVPGGGSVSDVQYTRVLREVGIVGFLVFMWMIFTALRIGWIHYRDEENDEFLRGICVGYICSLFGLLMMGVATEVFIIIRIMEPFWFISAIVVSIPEVMENERNEDALGLKEAYEAA